MYWTSMVFQTQACNPFSQSTAVFGLGMRGLERLYTMWQYAWKHRSKCYPSLYKGLSFYRCQYLWEVMESILCGYQANAVSALSLNHQSISYHVVDSSCGVIFTWNNKPVLFILLGPVSTAGIDGPVRLWQQSHRIFQQCRPHPHSTYSRAVGLRKVEARNVEKLPL